LKSLRFLQQKRGDSKNVKSLPLNSLKFLQREDNSKMWKQNGKCFALDFSRLLKEEGVKQCEKNCKKKFVNNLSWKSLRFLQKGGRDQKVLQKKLKSFPLNPYNFSREEGVKKCKNFFFKSLTFLQKRWTLKKM